MNPLYSQPQVEKHLDFEAPVINNKTGIFGAFSKYAAFKEVTAPIPDGLLFPDDGVVGIPVEKGWSGKRDRTLDRLVLDDFRAILI